MTTPVNLQALAGYCLTREESEFARLRAACAECIPLIPQAPTLVSVCPAAPRDDRPAIPEYRPHVQTVPEEVAQWQGITTCRRGGEHRINIATQQCRDCGRSYLDIRGRVSELMEPVPSQG